MWAFVLSKEEGVGARAVGGADLRIPKSNGKKELCGNEGSENMA